MMGSLSDDATKGIIPRLCDTLFEMIIEVSVLGWVEQRGGQLILWVEQ